MVRYAGVNAPGPGSLVDPQHPLGRGCIGCWWPNAAPDAGSGLWVPDLSGQGQHLLSNGCTWAAGQNGHWDAGLNLGGETTQYLRCTTMRQPTPLTDLTIAAQFSLNSASRGAGITWNQVTWYIENGNVYLKFDTTGYKLAGSVYNTGTMNMHCAMSGTSGSSYWKDGVCLISNSNTSVPGVGATLTVGRIDADYRLQGCLSSLMLWDRAFSPEEVAWLYREPACMIWVPGGSKTFLLGGAPAPLTVTHTATLYAAESYTATRGLGLSAAERDDLTRAMQLVGQEVETLARSLGLSAGETDSLTRAVTLRGLEALADTRTASLQAQDVTSALHAVQTYAQEVQDLSRAVALHASESEAVLRDLGAAGAEGLSVARALGLYATGGSDAEELLATWLVATFGAEQTSLTRGITLWAKEAAVGVRDVLRIADERGTLRLKDLRDELRIDDERDTLRLKDLRDELRIDDERDTLRLE